MNVVRNADDSVAGTPAKAIVANQVAEFERPHVRRRLPVVLSRDEVTVVSAGMQGEHALLARLL